MNAFYMICPETITLKNKGYSILLLTGSKTAKYCMIGIVLVNVNTSKGLNLDFNLFFEENNNYVHGSCFYLMQEGIMFGLEQVLILF